MAMPDKGFVFIVASSGVLAAVGSRAAEVEAPTEVAAAAPSGTHLIFYKASGNQPDADAVAVYETAADTSGSHKRDLVVFRKQGNAFQEVARNDRIIACSTCSPERDDPFMDGHEVKVAPGRIDVVQVYGSAQPTDVAFAFAYEKGRWKVISASRHESDDRTTKMPLPSSGLLKDFDGGWTATSYWSGLALNDRDHSFHFLLDRSSEAELDAGLEKACQTDRNCRVVARVQDGCLSLARDASGQSFPAVAQPTSSKVKVEEEAMSACSARGHGKCEIVRTSCSTGAIH